MGKFDITTEHEKAYESVIKAIKKAQKSGLVFYGKCGNLVAYTKEAADYADKDFESCFGYGTGSQIDCISKIGLIRDSGADDYPRYRSKNDEEKYS